MLLSSDDDKIYMERIKRKMLFKTRLCMPVNLPICRPVSSRTINHASPIQGRAEWNKTSLGQWEATTHSRELPLPHLTWLSFSEQEKEAQGGGGSLAFPESLPGLREEPLTQHQLTPCLQRGDHRKHEKVTSDKVPFLGLLWASHIVLSHS